MMDSSELIYALNPQQLKKRLARARVKKAD